MALDFKSVANTKMEEIERPPLPPTGTYRWRISKLPEQATVGKDDEWDVVNFQVQAVEALDDVDMSDYKGEVNNIANRLSFMFDKSDEVKFEQTLYRLKTFLEKHLGLTSPTVTEALNDSVGAEFLGAIRYRQDKNDDELFYAEIGRTAPID